jgi:hypothetical protein
LVKLQIRTKGVQAEKASIVFKKSKGGPIVGGVTVEVTAKGPERVAHAVGDPPA